MRYLACAALLVGGCTSLTDVDVGAPDIPPVASVIVVPMTDTEESPWSGGVEVWLIDAPSSDNIRKQYSDKLDAIDRIDAEVQELTFAAPYGEALPPGVTAAAALDGNPLSIGRHRLTDATKDHILGMVRAGQEVDLPLTVTLTFPPTAEVPGAVRVTVRAQPILVIQALKAL